MYGHEDNLNFMFCTFFYEKKKNRESEDLIFINNRMVSFILHYYTLR